jgi:ABC-type transport system involved in multi-copper enzyme maturation permease subunit
LFQLTFINTGCPKNGVLTVLYGVEEITVKVRKMLKKFYWTYLLHWRYLKVHLTGQLFRNICIKLSWQLPLIVHIITKYKITHYQHLIVHNREFRTFGNRKNYFKYAWHNYVNKRVWYLSCLSNFKYMTPVKCLLKFSKYLEVTHFMSL